MDSADAVGNIGHMSVALGMPMVRGEDTVTVARRRLVERTEDFPGGPGLADRFGRIGEDLRISVIDKCNLRCGYCMPAEGMQWLPREDLLSAAEIVRIVRIGVRLGVRELRLTGGEPLVRPDLEEIIAGVHSAHPELPISLTTNGIGLDKRAAGLVRAGLRRINVSLDTVDPQVFARMTRRDRLPRVLAGIAAARAAGLDPIKVNAVVLHGQNDHTVLELLDYCLAHGLQLRFIEQMPLDADHGWTRERMVDAAWLRTTLARKYVLEPVAEPRGGAPAELYEVRAADPVAPGRAAVLGRVGMIASVTEPFCAACTRTRITADGRVRSCLFSREEFDLAGLLRSGAGDALIADTWQRAMWLKPRAHGMDHAGLGDADYVQPERSMSAIGG